MKSLLLCAVLMAVVLPLFPDGQAETTYYEYRGISELVIRDTKNYSISIEGMEKRIGDGGCRIEIQQPPRSRYRVFHDTRDGVMQIWVRNSGGFFKSGNGPHRITVQLSSRVNASVAGDSGSISAEGLAGTIQLHSDSGKIAADSISGNIDISSDSGAVEAESLSGILTGRTDSGRFFLREFRGDCTLKSDSGSIELRRVSGMLLLRSDSGRIRGEGLLLGTNSIAVTDSGAIDLELINSLSELTIVSKTTSGRITLFDHQYSRTANVGEGEIGLELYSDSGRISLRGK